ncbi:YkyA family protein [Fundicoccus culcitae]|uniref:YkyA family protein n=1 Tax=Fundicoccus culcitae TaxID=2969821 RepID=A0ABY5P7F2_9LACT|nr:YkyA family protein [Fundicoccus culcitae]UUX34516.1 YkyA family protein [Fundicoccus culcitae]
MKSISKIVGLMLLSFILVGCDNSVNRADNTIGLMQDKVTMIINELNQIQTYEANLQADFETTLQEANDDLAVFNNPDTLVEQNIQNRKEHLDTLKVQVQELVDLTPELETLMDSNDLPTSQFQQVNQMINQLAVDINYYIENYQSNLELESMTFKSIAHPDTEYQSFFGVFDNINEISTYNLMNLDKVLGQFEPLNALLINIKVYLVNLQESN